MNKSRRRAVIAGNWKMNKTPSETKAFIEELKTALPEADCDVIVCVPFVDIAAAVEAAKGSDIKVGAQNVHFAENGAYTGEVSAKMLNDIGCEYVIIGHSERRQYFGETDETVNKRLTAALAAGLKVVLCVGEMKNERERTVTDEIVSMQTKIALLGVEREQMENIIIAYEPVWAIGTGLTATEKQADEVCGIIRSVISAKYGVDIGETTTIQYGGSMNAKNAASLLSKYHVDGGLIGSAALTADTFSAIVEATNQ